MRFLFLLMGITVTLWCSARQITTGEYFIDIDPGYGNATAFSFDADAEIDFSQNISVKDLSYGYHILYYRLKDNEGIWGQTSYKPFFKTVNLKGAEQVTEGEYSFDTDPGIGNANPFKFEADAEIDFSQNMGIDNLKDGYHTLYYRMKDNEGKWGHTAHTTFYKAITPRIAKLFYKIDSEDAVVVNIYPKVNKLEYTLNKSIAALDSGEHQIKFWVVNDFEIKSSEWTEQFTISNTDTTTTDIVNHVAELKLYPNPTTDYITIETSDDILSVSVYSLLGKLVLQDATKQKTIDLKNVQAGTYLISVKTAQGIIVKSIIKN